MPKPTSPARSPDAAETDDLAARLDAMMALPIKDRPAITVFGDDALAGFTPADPQPSAPTD